MIRVIRCGHDSRHPGKWDIKRKDGLSNYLLLLVKTEAYFELDGVLTYTEPNMAILFEPHTYIHYGSEKAHFNDDWLHFEVIDAPSPIDHLHIPFNTPLYLPHINQLSSYMRLLVQEEHIQSVHKEKIQDGLVHSLLYTLDAQVDLLSHAISHNKHYEVMSKLRANIFNAPHKKWTVEQMAQDVHMSPSYFQATYKKNFGISCGREVIEARLESARFYLTRTDMSIQALADFCGYDNDLHFMRQFKKYVGITPSQYRQFSRGQA